MKRGRVSRSFGPAGAALTLAGTAALVHWQQLGWLPAYLIAVNCVLFAFYGLDKALSRGRRLSRVPERTLHWLALAGGTPAALLGQHLFRHKTIKGSFRLRFWAIAALQAAAVGVWLWWDRWR